MRACLPEERGATGPLALRAAFANEPMLSGLQHALTNQRERAAAAAYHVIIDNLPLHDPKRRAWMSVHAMGDPTPHHQRWE